MTKKDETLESADAKLDKALKESFPASDTPAVAPAVENKGQEVSMHYKYQVRTELRPKRLEGISEDQIAQHWTLYEGYIKNVNSLNERLAALSQKGDFGVEFAELKRRSGFEYDGMLLHEHYFGILKSGQTPLGDDAELTKMLKNSFGGTRKWLEEFSAMGKMRGVGWVILYYDPRAQVLSNHWIGLHEEGHPSGFVPILVMDVWEHAYMVDAGAGGRAPYVDAFLQNVDWPKVDKLLGDAQCSKKAPKLHEAKK
ncbi:MAG: superoxide dismutase [Elusimicrobia bacterium CG_4_9_14_3_um_filter_62_55]|nr:MAG: superoxide dismutase [Elusimicrobia bacterium CG22_combo_CG10-13_8_21_14_all_63_91]PJA18225.1 MAG: superoxide dismutase [Elusimicrobia bacterium CG_4_10_14_0_2_um_filter_63_34]PJB26307.1 MAG: superoxide dismutase [Elusimicrobia bacterium CG_4_9_14_3_um_filter_62_55]